jgi:hypothetical protein
LEKPAEPPVVTFGGALIGPPAATTWLRLAHDVVPDTGEHRYRAASQMWGAAWTLPADATPRIGLVSQGHSVMCGASSVTAISAAGKQARNMVNV